MLGTLMHGFLHNHGCCSQTKAVITKVSSNPQMSHRRWGTAESAKGMGVGGIAAMPSVPSMDGLIRASSVPFPDGRRTAMGFGWAVSPPQEGEWPGKCR